MNLPEAYNGKIPIFNCFAATLQKKHVKSQLLNSKIFLSSPLLCCWMCTVRTQVIVSRSTGTYHIRTWGRKAIILEINILHEKCGSVRVLR